MLADFAFGFVFLYCADAIARADLRFRIVPDRFLLIMFAAGVLYAFLTPRLPGEDLPAIMSRLAYRSVVPGLSGLLAAMLYRILRHREGLGLGDVKLMAAAGVWLPVLTSVYAIAAASVIALIFTAAESQKGGTEVMLTYSVPFALFLAPAFWLFWLLERMQLLPF
ncbi:MAG: prepilin peptidase [Rhodomicrobium sp.]